MLRRVFFWCDCFRYDVSCSLVVLCETHKAVLICVFLCKLADDKVRVAIAAFAGCSWCCRCCVAGFMADCVPVTSTRSGFWTSAGTLRLTCFVGVLMCSWCLLSWRVLPTSAAQQLRFARGSLQNLRLN